MIKRSILAASALLCLVLPAQAQKTKAQITTEIGTLFPDNASGQITPLGLRTVTTDLVNSYVDYLACGGSGGIVYWAAGVPTCLSSGGSGQILSTNGTTPSWISLSAVSGGAALTKTDDTNVTVTLGGTPASALLAATSITLGWTGTLSLARGGTNNTLTASNGGIAYFDATKMNVLAGTVTSGLCLLSGSSAAPAWGSCAGGAAVASIAGNTGVFTLTKGITNTVNAIGLSLTNTTLQANPANPAATANATGLMLGLGSTCTLTPSYSGRIKLEFIGNYTAATAGTTVTIKAYYNSGGAPANGAAITGTQLANSLISDIPATSGTYRLNFTQGGIITGLTPGTAYWFDLSLGASGATSATVTNVSCNAMEF